ncbi:MAG: sulfatase-like hydrolase/transferase, partial [Candidatus Omnitrophica bacterium]|nr:sulfatase-like hydrolase/transferase [Candidatus Omnitrophota bacterium]
GTLTTKEKDSNRGRPGDASHYSPPWENGFDVCFSTEAKVPTWDPMIDPEESGNTYGTFYWTGTNTKETENLMGDDSRIIMDRAIPFIRKAVDADKPFFAVIWFHTPHNPVVAGQPYLEMYKDQDEDHAHYYGCITAMDEQLGRLQSELKSLGVGDNTMLWFCSDNGPAAKNGGPGKEPGGRQQGTTGPYRGRKGSLYEGGVRVPGLLVWPEAFPEHQTIDIACVTSDYLPTILDTLNLTLPVPNRPYDGVSLLPILRGEREDRPSPIAFDFQGQLALSDNRYKIYKGSNEDGYELYDLLKDPSESKDLSEDHPEILSAMKKGLNDWLESCSESQRGSDY